MPHRCQRVPSPLEDPVLQSWKYSCAQQCRQQSFSVSVVIMDTVIPNQETEANLAVFSSECHGDHFSLTLPYHFCSYCIQKGILQFSCIALVASHMVGEPKCPTHLGDLISWFGVIPGADCQACPQSSGMKLRSAKILPSTIRRRF